MVGKFIVIDGSDGSGKGTQTERVIAHLESEGKEVFKCDFPQYGKFFGKMVGEYLNNSYGDAVKLDPYMASLMYAGDRWQAKGEIQIALNEGKIVIANRYVPSNMAHQGAKIDDVDKRNKFLDWIEELEYEIYGIPKPDKIIVLYVPTEVAQKLVDKKDGRDYTDMKRDAHESDKNYLTKTAEFYKDLANQKNWVLIDCVVNGELLSIEEVTKEIISHL